MKTGGMCDNEVKGRFQSTTNSIVSNVIKSGCYLSKKDQENQDHRYPNHKNR